MVKKKTAKKAAKKKPGRAEFTMRLPADVLETLDHMAEEVHMTRTGLVTLILAQAAGMHRAEKANPGLFAPTEQLIEGALRRAVEKGRK